MYLTSYLWLDIWVVSFLSVINNADLNTCYVHYFPELIREKNLPPLSPVSSPPILFFSFFFLFFLMLVKEQAGLSLSRILPCGFGRKNILELEFWNLRTVVCKLQAMGPKGHTHCLCKESFI